MNHSHCAYKTAIIFGEKNNDNRTFNSPPQNNPELQTNLNCVERQNNIQIYAIF